MSEIRTDTINNASGDNDSGIDLSTNDQVDIKIAGSLKARVNSSGNLLVGTTNSSVESSSTDEGVNIFANKIGVARDGGVTANFNRLTSDGDIMKFRKDGTTVGSIGVNTKLYIGGSGETHTTGVSFQGSGTSTNRNISPSDGSGALVDGAINLGSSSYRWNSLYLSGQLSLNNGTTNGFLQSSGDLLQFGTSNSKNVVFYSANSERLRINSNGKIVTFNCANTGGALNLVGEGGAGNKAISFAASTTGGEIGSVVATGSSTSYNTSSDHRLKENVTADWDATTRLKQLNPVRFNFIADADTTVDGFLAHEVQSVVPEAITGTHNEVEVWKDGEELPDGVSVGDNKLDEDGNTIPVYQSIDQSKLVPLLTGALKEAIAKIEALETRIEALENA